MSLAAAFLLAAVAASTQPAPAHEPRQADRGAQIATAGVSVTIVRAAALKDGELASARSSDAPHSQRHDEGSRVIYAFE
jgi:hypothetical protein